MIGVIANVNEIRVVTEFFELFKTPWEIFQSDRSYDVVLISGDESLPINNVKLLIRYSHSTQTHPEKCTRVTIVHFKGERIPIYGSTTIFNNEETAILTEEGSNKAIGYKTTINDRPYCRIGYDLFAEISALLTTGQPLENAHAPTVELHIVVLRDLILEAHIPLIEIPPVPHGYAFIASLTHDMDHPSIRRHKWDHTAIGFLYRAVIGSLIRAVKGRISGLQLLTNWCAAAKWPFVHAGIARDFWSDFDRYPELEQGASSTFFVLPFKEKPGRTEHGVAPKLRASGYGAAELSVQLRALISSGCEVGLHGIDAWIDATQGKEESAEVVAITGTSNIGVRMHWLYFNQQSPCALEAAGFSYDSTVGYNETVGFRAGTTQVYKPLQADQLFELPLHVMDTALFYPSHLNLSFGQARATINSMIDTVIKVGGVITLNWHDRSLAPERLWGEFYGELVADLKRRSAWCTNASRAVDWFKRRRSLVFERTNDGFKLTKLGIDVSTDKHTPPVTIRIYDKDGTSYRESAIEDPMVCDPSA
jgi:hypothetical protein